MRRSRPKRSAVYAIDTNVVIRFLVADDKRQADKARQFIEGGEIFLSSTVLLECEWVLRSGYGIGGDAIIAALRSLAGLPGATIENPEQLASALDWMEDGMDFADALHLAKAQGCEAFVTFDRALASHAADRSTIPVERL